MSTRDSARARDQGIVAARTSRACLRDDPIPTGVRLWPATGHTDIRKAGRPALDHRRERRPVRSVEPGGLSGRFAICKTIRPVGVEFRDWVVKLPDSPALVEDDHSSRRVAIRRPVIRLSARRHGLMGY
jgi:hypothetical protein